MTPHGFGRWLAIRTLGAAGAGLLAAALGAVIVLGGLFDVRASKPHLAPVAGLTHFTMERAETRYARAVTAPKAFTAAQVQVGAGIYAQRCAACHGGPGVARATWAAGLTPTPPYLLDSAHQWSAAELFVIAHDGVKMTAMPAWGEAERPERVWAVVAFLEALPRLSAADYARLTAPTPAVDLLAATSRTPPSRP